MDELLIERRLTGVEKDVEDIKHDLYSNGQRGFIEETRDYVSQQRGMWKMILAIGIILGILEGVNTIRSFMRPLPIPVQHEQIQHSFED